MGAPVGGAMLTWRRTTMRAQDEQDIWTCARVDQGTSALRLFASNEGQWFVELTASGRSTRLAGSHVDAPPALLLARAQAAAVTAARAFLVGLGAGLRAGDEPVPATRIAGLVSIAVTDQLVLGGHTLLVAQRDQPLVRKAFLDVVGRLSEAAADVIDADTLDGASHGELLDTIGRPLIRHAAQAIVDEVRAHTRIQDAITALPDVDPPA